MQTVTAMSCTTHKHDKRFAAYYTIDTKMASQQSTCNYIRTIQVHMFIHTVGQLNAHCYTYMRCWALITRRDKQDINVSDIRLCVCEHFVTTKSVADASEATHAAMSAILRDDHDARFGLVANAADGRPTGEARDVCLQTSGEWRWRVETALRPQCFSTYNCSPNECN